MRLPGPQRLPDRAEVVVIGGGLTGVLVTAMLVKAGVDVRLIEGRDAPGMAASGRHLGHVTTGLIEHPYRLLHAMGAESAGDLIRFSRENHDILSAWTSFESTGDLWCALDEREQPQIAMSVEALEEMGVAVQPLDAAEVNERSGGTGLGPGMWVPGGGVVHPAEVVDELVAKAPGRVYVRSVVTGITDEPRGTVVHVGDRSIAAELVVVAANAWCPTIDAVFADKIHPVREQGLRFAPTGARLGAAGRAGYGYSTWRQAPDGGLMVAGCRWATPHMEVGETDDHRVVDAIQRKLEGFARVHFPEATESPITHRWSWITATTCDGLPIIGPLPGRATLIACAGFCGNELGLGARAAKAVVDGILHGDPSGVPAFLAASRFV
jgi:glycine/D-amino acid oxidase-like deaminating enzyme